MNEQQELNYPEIHILRIATNVYAFDPLPEDQVTCDDLVVRGLLKINSDGCHKIVQAGRQALRAGGER